VLTGPLPPLAIPDTLQDALLARLDRLATVKAVARPGAVLGREFAYEWIVERRPTRGRITHVPCAPTERKSPFYIIADKRRQEISDEYPTLRGWMIAPLGERSRSVGRISRRGYANMD
jgi:hypothetical protein